MCEGKSYFVKPAREQLIVLWSYYRSCCSVFLMHQNWCLCLRCSISILHHFTEECTSINSNIISCLCSSPLDLLEFQLLLFVQVLLFHPNNKEKVFRDVRHSHLHLSNFCTTQSDKCLSREKTPLLCCSLFIYLSYEMHVVIRSF